MGFILGLHGPAKAGKDTIADYLVSKYGWGEKISFAYNLKEMCKAVFNLTEDDVNTQEGKQREFATPKVFTQRNLGSVLYWMSKTHRNSHPPKGAKEAIKELVGTELHSPRHVLQFVGTDVCRMLVPTYHLDVVLETLRSSPDKNFVVTDVRFPNEGDAIIDEFGGIVFQVLRYPQTVDGVDRSHNSEVAMCDWGRFADTVDNQKDGLDFLFEEVNSLLKRQPPCQEEMIRLSRSQKETSSHMEGTEDLNGTGTTTTISLTDVD